MAQWLKHLPSKSDNQSSSSPNHIKWHMGITTHLQIAASEDRETEIPQSKMDTKTQYTVEFWVCLREPAPRNRVENWSRLISDINLGTPCAFAHICMRRPPHICPYACIPQAPVYINRRNSRFTVMRASLKKGKHMARGFWISLPYVHHSIAPLPCHTSFWNLPCPCLETERGRQGKTSSKILVPRLEVHLYWAAATKHVYLHLHLRFIYSPPSTISS